MINRMTDAHFHALQQLAHFVSREEDQLHRCAKDETEDLHFLPDVVIEPLNTEEVAAVLQYCSQHTLLVTPRGAGTGLSGGALPVSGGVVLDMRRMNKIIHL